MSMNIKSERVHELAREAARRTGQSQTSVVEEALRKLLADLERNDEEAARRRRLHQLFEEAREQVTDEDRAAAKKFMDELYDENGLPA
ncbi:type II toxin-antitoxin system VapB family antitoxin [Nocardioides speluncae]|uniref:type II toxin-antitoxin system VapB family antitoxin n=1 Tax=Nocardioides speluncae TaxID=2670337 RepID=UPI000D69D104|nr:type II toxin-antitoxin system VapB family antitoxin [Nocardioides speluncae]